MTSPTGEARFDFEGERWTLLFDFAALAFFEREAGVSIVEAMAGIERARRGRTVPMISHLAYLVQAGLSRHHPEVTPEKALAMACERSVQDQLGLAMEAATPPSGNEKARSTSKASTGTGRSKPRSKRG